MKPFSLLICFFIAVVLAGVSACQPEEAAQPTTPTCRLTSATDQLIESNGQLTSEIQRTFLYQDGLLIGMREQSPNQTTTFGTAYTDGRLVQTAGNATVIQFAFSAGGTTPPTSATFSQNGQVQSTFTMEYNPAGRLSRLVESRTVLPANSLTVKRAYTFTYDNTGNLTNERAAFTFRDGLVLEQETEYTSGTNPSPYTHLPERSALTVIALSRVTESYPGRFWHLNAPIAYKTYDLTTTGSRGTLRESVTYAPTYDAGNKLTTQDQTALLYQSSVPTPVTKKNRQTFAYQCE